MRKIYSLVLIAVGLLIGTNAWAVDYSISLGAAFDDAWKEVAKNGGKITLNSDITVSTVTDGKIYWLGTENMGDAAKTVEIDLNGNTMEFNGQFLLTHGTLKITTPAGTEGKIVGKKSANLFYVTGSTNKDVDPSVDGANYFTHLYIGEGVTVSQFESGYSAAIRIEEVYSGNPAAAAYGTSVPVKPALTYATNIFVVPNVKYSDNKYSITQGIATPNKGVAYGVRIDVYGTVEGQKYGIQTSGYLGSKAYYDDKMAKLNDELPSSLGTGTLASKVNPNNVSLDLTKPFYAQVKDMKNNTYDAGSFALDNIKNHTFGTDDDEKYSSYVHIYPTGTVKAKEDIKGTGTSSDQPFGIYAGGYGRWKVEGTVTGCTGALVKSGIVDFENATVEGTGSKYNSANNSTSGSAATGCGIVISTEDSYVGETQVTVQGDSYVAANNGYALEEIITTQGGEGESKVEAITIDGGTFAGGKIGEDPNTGDPIEGTITITEKTADQENTVTINGLSVTGTGANITETTDGVSIGGKSLEEYFSEQNIHITTVPDGDGTSTYVISIGDAPTPGNLVSTNADNSNASVKWITNAEDVIATGRHLKLAELEINDFTDNEKTNPREQTLTIQSGATLEVGRVILGPKAHIIVKAGGKLLVTGTDGIIANQYDNITLESSESAQAIFLFHPLVSSNRHPNATVKLTSKGYVKGGDYNKKVWQRFGVPAYTSNVEKGAVTRKSTNQIEYNDNGWIAAYDYSIDNWISMPDEDAFVPFQCYEASSVATEPNHTIYTFKCPLMGNSDFTLPLNEYTEWNYYANSYMAPIDIEQMLTSFVTNEAKVKGTVYVYRSEDNWWDNINLGQLGYFPTAAQTKIDPMQAFIFQKNAEGTTDAVINYKKHIYNPDPTTTPVAAPVRNREVFSAAIVEIEAADGAKDKLYLIESDKFTADFDNGYDAAKYMNNESFNIFAGEQLGIIATDNLEGTAISMTSKAQTSFTMTFSNVTNMEYAIRDNLTGTETAIEEGATYMFSVAADANIEGRFEVVPMAKVPTAIENVEATAAAKGIYTITGQFVGNDYHSLPNGIYVVDGKKIVK